jgi:hypothetical protein
MMADHNQNSSSFGMRNLTNNQKLTWVCIPCSSVILSFSGAEVVKREIY